MRWYEIIRESEDSIINQTHDAIMDMLTPLQSQGISSITVNQVMDQLRSDPSLQGINLSNDLIMQAISGASGIKVAPDMQNNGKLTISIDNSTPSTDAAQKQSDQGQQKVDQAALRQSTKDLN